MGGRLFLKSGIGVISWVLSVSAGPIVKTGPCPELTRYAAPSDENWGQFPNKPSPKDSFPVGTVQNPLTPEESINCLQVAAGLRAEIWASEKLGGINPGLGYIQHFTFDERGRMWAVEPRSYPNTIRPATGSVTDEKFQGGADRILILEDTDGDKAADKVTVFRDGLNMPQGIEVVNGGVVVAMTPYLVFFPNNNDTAGTPIILWSGLGGSGNFDTGGGNSNLMYGLDNWIYGMTGYNSCSVNGSSCGQGRVWRFQHTALGHAIDTFEVWNQGTGTNSWGLGQMEDGQIFESRVNSAGAGHINHGLGKGRAIVDIRDGSNKGLFYPITGDRFLWEGSTSKDAQGWFTSTSTAVSGMQFYTSRLFPQKYWNRFAFVCEGASKLCNQDSLVESGHDSLIGSTWRAVRLPGPERSNLLASKDAWFSPILAKTGPDGAVWVLDWYNYLFLHNPAAPLGAGNAWQNHLREKSRVRIYRVVPEDGRSETLLDLSRATVAQWVEVFANPNLHWRLQAQRLLMAKGYSEELGQLLEDILAKDKSVDAVGNNPRVVHALWTLHGQGRLTADTARWNPRLADLLRHPAWGVRRNVLRVMPRTAASVAAIGSHCTVNDTHGHVRYQALLALAEIKDKPADLPALWTEYEQVDGGATITAHAAIAAGEAGLRSVGTRPCQPALYPRDNPPTRAHSVSQPRSDLRFSLDPSGFRLMRHGQLPSGDLTVWDPKGRAVFRSRYNAAMGQWSMAQAEGLRRGVHFYTFSGEGGAQIQGRFVLFGQP
jgi:uncharacterized protein